MKKMSSVQPEVVVLLILRPDGNCFLRLKVLRTLCLWEDWESLEPQVASAILDGISSGEGPGPQSPYETRLTGEIMPLRIPLDA